MEEKTENETRERLRADSEEGTGWESRGKFVCKGYEARERLVHLKN